MMPALTVLAAASTVIGMPFRELLAPRAVRVAPRTTLRSVSSVNVIR